MLRKIVSLCLALVLIVSVLPQIGILSQAAPLDECDTTADGQIETVNALNALLVGVRFAPEDYGTEVRNWPDEAICNAISGKLLWDDYLYDDSSYLSGIGLEYWTGEDWYWHFDLDLIQKITQSTLGRDFSDNAGSEYIFISGNELLLMPATGESTTLSVQSYTKQDNRIIAAGIAVYTDNISSEFLGYFQAMFEENASSIYGYTLRSLERVTSDQNFKNIKASASSELDGGASTYYAGNVLDGDLSTAWAEGVPGDGVDEWIRLETTDGSPMDVSAIQFAMGYQKSDQLLEKNSWPYEVLIEAEGGFNQTVELYWYTDMFILDQPVKTNWIKITILGVEEGSAYDDTCISEIRLYGINVASASMGYTPADIEQMVTDYYNEHYVSEENPGKYVVFSGETTVNGDICKVVVRFQGDNATTANVFVADVSVNMTTGEMFVDGALLGSLNLLPSDEDDPSAETNSTYDEYARSVWIEQHMEYAASDEYQSEIVGGYSKRMMAVFRDALDDEDINSYETRKVVSSILNLELEFSETDMYELILAEILYGESGQSVTEEAYAQNLEKAVANITKVLADIATTGDSAKDIPEDTLRSIRELYELLQTLELGSEEYSTTYGKFISLIKGNVADIKSKIKTELVGDAAFAGLGIVIEGAFEQYDALEDILNYLNNYVAYQSTSQQTRDVLEKLLVVIYKNSDVNGLLSGDQILNELGLSGSMINWADFRVATLSVMEAMVKYEQEGAAAVATYAVDREREAASKFGQKAIKSVAVFAIEKAASCVPVINAILVAKNIVSAAVSASVILDQIFTNVTEREYAQDILTKSYIISVMLDQTVDDCASCMEEDDFYSSTVFDRSVIIYKQNLLNASGYAVKYADMVLKDAQQELFEYDQEWHLFDGRERLVKAVDWYTNSLAMLKEQQVDIESIACHDSDLYYDPLTDEIIYNFKDSRIYIVACPVSVVVKNEVGEQIAYLSGESDQVAEGYEFYFHTIKATADSGEYIKVAIVPDNYQIELIGTDDGTMNAFVADFTADDVGEVETYFNVPIKKDSVGYFEAATDGSDSTALVMDEAVYLNMESSEDIPTEANGNIQWIWILGGVTVTVTALLLLLRKKTHKA